MNDFFFYFGCASFITTIILLDSVYYFSTDLIWSFFKLEAITTKCIKDGYNLAKPYYHFIIPEEECKPVTIYVNNDVVYNCTYLDALKLPEKIEHNLVTYELYLEDVDIKNPLIIFKNLSELTNKFTFSEVKFISVILKIEGEEDYEIIFDKNFYITGNILFDKSFMKLCNIPIKEDSKYKIDIIDDNINTVSISNDQYIQLTNNNYNIINTKPI